MSESPVDPQFVLEHAAHVRALARRLVFDDARADDLEQETWLAALGNAPREMTSPRGWLARIASRRAVHDWRAASRRDAREAEVARPGSVASSEVVVEREETRTQVVRAVLALDEPYRSALVAQFLEERSPRDAAKVRNVPVETQRTQVKRGIEILRERMKRSHGFGFAAFQLALVRDLRLEAPLGATLAAAGTAIVGGGILMGAGKQFAVAAAVVLVAVLAFVRPWESIDARRTEGPAGGPPVELASSGVDTPAEQSARVAPIVAPQGADASSGVAGSETKSAVVVLAHVVDERGRPIEGAKGILQARSGASGSGLAAYAGFESASDARGDLRVEAPTLPARGADLVVDGGPYRTVARVIFDASLLRTLRLGENEAGEVVLRPAGRLRGRVQAGGVSLANVEVEARSELSSSTATRTRSDANGRFDLASVPTVCTALRFTSSGHLRRDHTVAVEPVMDLDIGDVELEPAPSIAGIVLDDVGQPFPGVRVQAEAVGASSTGEALSGSNGAFQLSVEAAGAYDLSFVVSPEWKPWGGRGVEGARFQTGEKGVRLVAVRSPATRFRVIDGAGAPVHEFGIAVQSDRSRPIARDFADWNEHFPRSSRRESNETVLAAEPGLNEVFLSAPGFVPMRVLVAHDAGSERVQTLRLERGRTLRGRILRGGMPLEQAQVTLGRAHIALGPEPRVPGTIELGRTHTWDLGSFVGRSREVVTRSDGSFEFSALSVGTYGLSVAWGGGRVHRIESLRVGGEGDVDLGDVSVALGATLRGRLVVGAGSPAGWEVSVLGRTPVAIEREDGTFEMPGLPPGETTVRWYLEGAFGLELGIIEDVAERSMLLTLAAGETREVVLDATACAPGRLSVVVLVDREPLTGASLELFLRLPNAGTTGVTRGPTTEAGVWSGLIRSGAEVCVRVASTNGLLLAASEPIVLVPGVEREIVIQANTGRIELRLPESLVLPESGGVIVRLAPRGEAIPGMSTSRWLRNAPVRPMSNGSWAGLSLALGRAGAGEWTIHVEVFRYSEHEPGGWSQENVLPPFELPVTIRAGETTVVKMP